MSLVAEHSTAIVAAAYLFSALVGTTYHLFLFRYFGLSVFDYWEGADYLIAAVREPVVLVLAVLAVIITVSMIWNKEIDAWARQQGRIAHMLAGNYMWERLGVRLTSHPAAGVLLGLLFFTALAWDKAVDHAEAVAAGREDRVVVYPAPDGSASLRAGLVTRTSSFVIVTAPETGAVFALTLEGLNALQLCGSAAWEECMAEVDSPSTTPGLAPSQPGTESGSSESTLDPALSRPETEPGPSDTTPTN